MKKLIYLLLVSLAVISCKKDKDSDNTGEDTTVTKSTISAKWIMPEDSDFESIEFNASGNYIII